MTPARHVIFGAGPIGPSTLDALRRRGETVRLVNRSGHARVPDDVEVVGSEAGAEPSPSGSVPDTTLKSPASTTAGRTTPDLQ